MVITGSGDKPKNRAENKRVKKTTASIPSYLLNLWSLAPPNAARAQCTRFLRQKPWREEIERWLSAGFLRRKGLGMHPGRGLMPNLVSCEKEEPLILF